MTRANTTRAEARRLRVHTWRDPRLLAGLLLVIGSTVLGARLWAAHDDTVAVWSLARPVVAGDVVQRADLTTTRVQLGAAGEYYLRTDEALPAELSELVWVRDATPGLLLDRSAVAVAVEHAAHELPLNVAAGSAPADLARGERVDVWVGPGPGQDPQAASRLLLEGVRVVSTGGEGTAVGGALSRTVLVDVSPDALGDTVMSALATGHVTLVRVS